MAVASSTGSGPGTAPAGDFISVSLTSPEARRITSLRFDPAGRGHHGPETIAAAGGLEGFQAASVDRDTLTLSGTPGTAWHWDLPFVRSGYYDADIHVNYSTPLATGAAPLALPFRRFVTSTGQYVNIEHFKRLPPGPWMHGFNVAEGGELLLVGAPLLGADLLLTCPGVDSLGCTIADHALRLQGTFGSQPVTIRVRPAGSPLPPGEGTSLPSVVFEPDFEVRCPPTGKAVGASALMTDLLRTGIAWHPGMTVVGDWGLGAVETHMLDDPRSWYLRRLRRELLRCIGHIGYDRFEHFGLMFAWGRFPDYGAGGLLNLPPENAPWDMRMLHLNGQWIETVARYVLATGDTALLRSKRVRQLATDGVETQPLTGRQADCPDYVLAAGDVRLDGRPPRLTHTLSQRFRARSPFSTLILYLGTESPTEPARGRLILTDYSAGRLLLDREFEVRPGPPSAVRFDLPERMPPGEYRAEIGDLDSGRRYFGPGLCWMTDPDSPEDDPPAGSGPMAGTLYDRLVVLLDYLIEHAGAGRENLIHYRNDPEYNIPDHKSGRHGVCTENSFWEAAGGGYDAFEGLWYNAACRAMAELATLMNDPAAATRYRNLARLADEAYNARYWHTAVDSGRAFQRYHACVDWDGRIHDYGFAYYNLEAVCRGIASGDQARSILWWLDRGRWSPDGGQTWHDDIYSIWGFAPPFNTIANFTWLNVTGTLPYRQVLANGGTRPGIAGRDLLVRSRYLGADALHARNLAILSRYASPDRLTGGRVVNDPGGRGRWHFGPPHIDRADVEGFREIFPQNGDMVTAQVMAYLGMEHSAEGLWLGPRVPSGLESVTFHGIGYGGGLLSFQAQALRREVPIKPDARLGGVWTFSISERFNRVGLQVPAPLSPWTRGRMTLTLDGLSPDGWRPVARCWFNDLPAEGWLWLTVDHWLEPGRYRLRAVDEDAATVPTSPAATFGDSAAVRCQVQWIRLTVRVDASSPRRDFRLRRGDGSIEGPSTLLATVLEPGQRACLYPLKHGPAE